jgi:hypothetical protein
MWFSYIFRRDESWMSVFCDAVKVVDTQVGMVDALAIATITSKRLGLQMAGE